MSNLFFYEAQFSDNPNVAQICRIYTSENYATITAAGWGNAFVKEGFILSPKNKYLISYNSGSSVGFFNLAVSSGNYTFSVDSSDVILPVVSGNFASFSGTSGAIADLGYSPSDSAKTKVVMAGSAVQVGYIAHFVDVNGTIDDTAAAVTNAGNIYAGLSGTAGVLRSYPSAATTGYLGLTGVANAADYAVQIANVSHGQATIHSIPDPGNAAARFLVGATATPFTSGNFPKASGTGGLMVDSGLAVSDIQNKTNIIAAQSADIGGAGAGPIDITVASATSSSIAVATVLSSSNAVSILKVLPGAGKISVTFSGDPGAAAVINYVVFVAAQ